jgi:hypothetical protein
MAQGTLTSDLLKLGQQFGSIAQRSYKASENLMRRNASSLMTKYSANVNNIKEDISSNPNTYDYGLSAELVNREDNKEFNPISELKKRYGNDPAMLSIIEQEYEPTFNQQKSSLNQRLSTGKYEQSRRIFASTSTIEYENAALIYNGRDLENHKKSNVNFGIPTEKASKNIADGAIVSLDNQSLSDVNGVVGAIKDGKFYEYMQENLFYNNGGIDLIKDKEGNWKVDSHGGLMTEDDNRIMKKLMSIQKSFTERNTSGNLEFEIYQEELALMDSNWTNGKNVTSEDLTKMMKRNNAWLNDPTLSVDQKAKVMVKYDAQLKQMQTDRNTIMKLNNVKSIEDALSGKLVGANGTVISGSTVRNVTRSTAEGLLNRWKSARPEDKREILPELFMYQSAGVDAIGVKNLRTSAESGSVPISSISNLEAFMEIIQYDADNSDSMTNYGVLGDKVVRQTLSNVINRGREQGKSDEELRGMANNVLKNARVAPRQSSFEWYAKALNTKEGVEAVNDLFNSSSFNPFGTDVTPRPDQLDAIKKQIAYMAYEMRMTPTEFMKMSDNSEMSSWVSNAFATTKWSNDKDFLLPSTGGVGGTKYADERQVENMSNYQMALFRLENKELTIDSKNFKSSIGYAHTSNRPEDRQTSNHAIQYSYVLPDGTSSEPRTVHSEDVMKAYAGEVYSTKVYMEAMKRYNVTDIGKLTKERLDTIEKELNPKRRPAKG